MAAKRTVIRGTKADDGAFYVKVHSYPVEGSAQITVFVSAIMDPASAGLGILVMLTAAGNTPPPPPSNHTP